MGKVFVCLSYLPLPMSAKVQVSTLNDILVIKLKRKAQLTNRSGEKQFWSLNGLKPSITQAKRTSWSFKILKTWKKWVCENSQLKHCASQILNLPNGICHFKSNKQWEDGLIKSNQPFITPQDTSQIII